MYTEVGEQMAEQNILNGNQKKLEQIIGDVKEHNTKKDRLEKLAESVKDISKELDNARKEKQNETDSKIKASTDAICAGYDKSIEADKEKIKTVSAERDKAKMILKIRLMKRLYMRISLKYITVSYLYRCLIPSSFWIM